MNWALFASTFTAIFLAELGDKTQIAVMTAAASNPGSRFLVFLGASAALVLSTALGVAAGDLVSRYVAPTVLHRIAGAVFILMGAALLYRGS
jgi:putative Ca2+/H+ antiporter (TMEM165/GDT1 family)